jgi:lipid II:glycine glycyltransferase (peptidoglycan interpeptide bridge formation enzyme)
LKHAWNELIAALPGAHILQTYEWGQVKVQNGWRPHYLVWQRSQSDQDRTLRFLHLRQEQPDILRILGGEVAAAALLLVRSAGRPLPMSLAYCPKGPLLEWNDRSLRLQVLSDLTAAAGQEGAILLKIDPEVRSGTGIPEAEDAKDDATGIDVTDDLVSSGWTRSVEQVQYKNTVLLDLTPSPEEILAGFKPKMRYNIRLAERRGVQVRNGDTGDIPLLYRLYAETAVRDGFTIRGLDYYQRAWGDFLRDDGGGEGPGGSQRQSIPEAQALIAEADGEAIAGLIVYRFAQRAWFLFGMSSREHREKMPTHRLQWEAILRMREAGCTSYDLWGAPDKFFESDPLWGVYRFKEGFQGVVTRTIGAWDLPLRPAAYRLYSRAMPRILGIMRGRGKRRTQREAA